MKNLFLLGIAMALATPVHAAGRAIAVSDLLAMERSAIRRCRLTAAGPFTQSPCPI